MCANPTARPPFPSSRTRTRLAPDPPVTLRASEDRILVRELRLLRRRSTRAPPHTPHSVTTWPPVSAHSGRHQVDSHALDDVVPVVLLGVSEPDTAPSGRLKFPLGFVTQKVVAKTATKGTTSSWATDGPRHRVLCQGQVKFMGVGADLRLVSCDLGSASASLRMPDMSSPSLVR